MGGDLNRPEGSQIESGNPRGAAAAAAATYGFGRYPQSVWNKFSDNPHHKQVHAAAATAASAWKVK